MLNTVIVKGDNAVYIMQSIITVVEIQYLFIIPLGDSGLYLEVCCKLYAASTFIE